MQAVDILEPDEPQVELDGALASVPLLAADLELLDGRVALGGVKAERRHADEQLEPSRCLGEL